MYWTTPSGTRYQTGSPARTRSRQSVELIAIAGTSWRVTPSGGQPVLGEHVPGTGHTDEVGQAPELLGVLPREDPGERVRAGDEEELGVRALGGEVAQGVDGEGRSLAVDVDPGHGEARVRCRRDDGHQVAVLGGGDLPTVLLPGLPRGNEDDLLELEERLHFRGGDEVPVVDGVEGPPITPTRTRAALSAGARGARPVRLVTGTRRRRLARGGRGRWRPRRDARPRGRGGRTSGRYRGTTR